MGQQLKIPFMNGMKVGLGYELLTGSPSSNPAVVGSAITPPQKGSGQTVTTTFRLVQEVDALQEALGLSAAVSGGYAGFSGSAKMEFAQQCAVTQYCLYVVLAVEVINSCESIDNPCARARRHGVAGGGNGRPLPSAIRKPLHLRPEDGW